MKSARKSIWYPALLALALLAGPRLALAQTSPIPHGNVGVGTYATVAQYKDLKVTAGDKVLLTKTLAEGLTDFDLSGGGQWKVTDNVLQQSSTAATGMNIFTGDKAWTDYVVTVQARKVSGTEGFSLAVRALDSKNFACLNVGGWGNTKAQFGITTNANFAEIGDNTPMKVDTGRWYEVKIDVKGDQATGFVDGVKVATARLVPPAAAARGGGRGNNNPGGGTRPAGAGGGTPVVSRGNTDSGAPAPASGGGGSTGNPLSTPPAAVAKVQHPPEGLTSDQKVLLGVAIGVMGLFIAGFVWSRRRAGGAGGPSK